MTMRAGLYARISLDDMGLEKGVTRQMEDARELCAVRGWSIEGQYTDNDVSAYKGAARPGYARLMADVEDGKFDVIVVWQTSRLWRSRADRAQAITRLGQLRISVIAVKGPALDLSTAYGRGLA